MPLGSFNAGIVASPLYRLEMKKAFVFFLVTIFLFSVIIFFLNIRVTTRRGVDYQLQSVEIPLYLKILDFYDRHYNYKELVKNILKDVRGEQECAMRLFAWTFANIRKNTAGLPVLDDHVWNIIIRGYGASDQSCDVFTTLCNYAGLRAFFSYASSREQTDKIPLSFVYLDKKWRVFDPYNGVYFQDKQGNFADMVSIRDNFALVKCLGKTLPDLDYSIYIDSLLSIKDIGYNRANLQSPLNRLIFEIKKKLKQSVAFY